MIIVSLNCTTKRTSCYEKFVNGFKNGASMANIVGILIAFETAPVVKKSDI